MCFYNPSTEAGKGQDTYAQTHTQAHTLNTMAIQLS